MCVLIFDKEPRIRGRDMVGLSRRSMLTGAAAMSGISAITPWGALASAPSAVTFEKVTALAFDGTSLVLASSSLWRSEDGGARWHEVPYQPEGAVSALATHPDWPGRIVAALKSGGLSFSVNSGASWSRIDSGLPEAPAMALTLAAHQPTTIYLSVAGSGLWQSQDAGATWTFAIDRPRLDEAEHDVRALASVSHPSGMGGIWIYAGTEAGLTKVPDCLCRWQDVPAGNAMNALEAGEEPPRERSLPPGEAVVSLALVPDTPDVIFAATPSGIWKTVDAGGNWDRVSDALASHLAVNPFHPDHIIAATSSGIVSSHDRGLTWAEPVPDHLPL